MKWIPPHRVKPSRAADSWPIGRIKEHPIKFLTLAAFAFGGLLLLMFFIQIREFPNVDLASSASLLLTLAATGAIVVVFLLAIPMLPALFTRAESREWRRTNQHVAILSLPAVVLLMTLLLPAIIGTPVNPNLVLFIAACIGLMTIAIRYFYITRISYKYETKLPHWVFMCGDMSIGIAVWTVTLLIGFLFTTGLYGSTDVEGLKLILGSTSELCLVWLASFVAAKLDWNKQWAALLFLMVAADVVPAMVIGNFTAIGSAVVRALGLGERPSRLVVSAAGCDILNKAVGATVCEVRSGETRGVVCPAILKSRIGALYFIELSPLGQDGTWPERQSHPLIPMAKSEVISWPKIDIKSQSVLGQAASALSPQLKHHYLTYLHQRGLRPSQIKWLDYECGVAAVLLH